MNILEIATSKSNLQDNGLPNPPQSVISQVPLAQNEGGIETDIQRIFISLIPLNSKGVSSKPITRGV